MSDTKRGENDSLASTGHVRLGRLVWVGVVFINIALLLLALWSFEDRQKAMDDHLRLLASNYAKILDGNIAGTFDKIDLALSTVVGEVERQARDGAIQPQRMLDFLRQQDRFVPETLGLRVSDAEGWIQYAASLPANQAWKPVDIRDRPHFIVFKNDPGKSDLFISEPVHSKISQQPIIALARRHNKPDGSFGGIVYAALPISLVIDKLSQIELGKHGNTGLWTATTLIARYTPEDSTGASSGAKTPSKALQDLIASGVGDAEYRAASGIDGIERDYHFRKFSRYPIYLVVGMTKDDYAEQFRHTLFVRMSIMAVLMLGTLVLAWQLSRSWQRLGRTQDHLAQLNEALRQQYLETEAAKRESELILSAAGEGICGIDCDGRIVFINPSARAMFGWDANEGIGSNLHDQTHHHRGNGSPYPDGDCPLKATLRDGQPRRVDEDLFWRKDGTSFPVEYTVAPLTAHGVVIGAVNVFHDISARKETENELAAYRNNLEALVAARTAELLDTEAKASMILNSSADGLYGIDQRGIIRFANPAACNILGYASPEQMIGHPAHALLHHSRADGSPYPSGDCPSYRSLRDGAEVRVTDEVYWRADGQAVPVVYATHPMHKDGEIIGAVTSFSDATEQRAAIEARERALVAAERLARTRSEFIANMSHEIRTPLNGVMGFAAIGLRHVANVDKVRDAFAKIEASGNRLLGVINDILDFSKIEAGKLEIRQSKVAIRQLIQQTVELLEERIEAKGLSITLELADDLPPSCLCDDMRLGQVLLNILSNAVKFTEAGTIRLAVGQTAGKLVFSITDSGIGMSDEQLAALFTPFYQADASASRKYGGTGLGLVISQRLLELMGGEIHVSSAIGQGATVDFSIPLRLPDDAAGQPPARLPATSSDPMPLLGISVLAVDDESINRMLLEEILDEAGARVSLAEGGQEAVELIRSSDPQAFDIVLMDLQMPGLGGYGATEIIRGLVPDLPVVAQTAHAFAEERERCQAAGMKAHIAKPLDPDELIAVVLRHARRRG